MSDKMVECPVCHKHWSNDCQQATVIAKHNQCCCRYVQYPPEGMTLEKCEAELVEMFGPGNYFPKSESIGCKHNPLPPKRHVNVGMLDRHPMMLKSLLSLHGRDALQAGTQIHSDLERLDQEAFIVDVECMSHLERKILEGATRLSCVEGVVVAADGSKQSLAEAVMAALASDKPPLIVIDSIADGVEQHLVVKPKTVQKDFVLSPPTMEPEEFTYIPPRNPDFVASRKKTFEERQKARRILPAMTALAMCGVMPPMRKAEKPLMKCGLPGCTVKHNHNGGYCSPEHCKEHKGKV